MLKLQIIGNIGQNAKVQEVNGKTAINFAVAHNKKFKLADGTEKETTVWVNCTKWLAPGKQSKLANYLLKGTRVFVEGEPFVRPYVNNANQAAASQDLTVTNLELISVPDQQQNKPVNQSQQQSQQSEAMPENTDFLGARDDNDDLPPFG